MKEESEMSVKEWVEFHQGKHFCQCGCEEEIEIKNYHHSPSYGIPRYINGHGNKTKEARERNSRITKQRYIDDPDLAKRQSESLKQYYLDNPEAKEILERKGSDNGMFGIHRYDRDAPNYQDVKIIGKICEYCGNIIEKYSCFESRFCSYECMGKIASIERIGLNSGEKHWNWQGGIISERDKFISSPEYKSWRTSIFERDNYTCQECGIRGGHLNSHHILPYRDYPKEQFSLNINNGITLCTDCHRQTYGKEYEFFNKYFDLANGVNNV